MFDYLQKFNNLPSDLQAKVSSPAVMAIISDLERKYKVDLAMVIMKIMTKSLHFSDLAAYFVNEFSIDSLKAQQLVIELKEKIFMSVADYLGLSAELKSSDLDKDFNSFIKGLGIVLPSSVLVKRFKNIIKIYLKGVRNKIDTRNTLAKNVKIGGLNLSEEEIGQILKACDDRKYINKTESLASKSVDSISNKLVSSAAQETSVSSSPSHLSIDSTVVPEYNLKQAIKDGKIKHLKISAPQVPLDLPLNKSVPKIASSSQADSKPKVESESVSASMKMAPSTSSPKPVNLQATVQSQAVTPSPSLAGELGVSLTPLHKIVPSNPPAPSITQQKNTPVLRSFKKTSFWSRLSLFKKESKSRANTPKLNATSISKPLTKSSVPAPPVSKSVIASSKPSLIQQSISPLNVSAPKQVISRPAPTSSASHPAMQDIKAMPKVMGPIEELKFLDLLNFRRLGHNPKEATDKILNKIKLLEQEGYDKMVAGVLAWRQSPLNRLYLRLGQEALDKNVPLKDYVLSLQNTGKEQLSFQDIEALLSLNSKLIF